MDHHRRPLEAASTTAMQTEAQSTRGAGADDVQLQQDPIRVAINEALLALLGKVCLERTDSFWVVTLQATDYLAYLGGPLLWVFVVAHGGQREYRWSGGGKGKLSDEVG